jgi:ABC-type branched-subunit amino acid transport system substrate-binding protein
MIVPSGHQRVRITVTAAALLAAALPAVALNTAAGASAPAGGETFGELAWPCGPGEGDNADDGSTPGVTAEEITIGMGDDAGFSFVPGLNHQATDAMEAMIAKCNELGGINGRQIVGNYYDAKFAEVTTAIQQACDDGVFFMVGQGWANDNEQEEIRQGCGLPSVPTYTVSPAFANAPLQYQGNPNPADEQPVGGLSLFAQQFPTEAASAGFVYSNIPSVVHLRDKIAATAPAVGWNFSADLPANPAGEADWTPFATQLRDGGVQAVYWGGSCFPNLGLFLQTAAANDYHPLVFGAPNNYEQNCSENNGDGALDNMYFALEYVPIEEAEHNKATQDYVDIVSGAGGDLSLLGMQATSSFLLWASASSACGATLTRECVLENLAATNEWTAGGLHSTSSPGGNHPATCTALFKYSGTTIERVTPAEPATFTCDEELFLGLAPDTPGVAAIDLDENRVSQLYAG